MGKGLGSCVENDLSDKAPKTTAPQTIYVVMANDYPAGASTTREGAEEITRRADDHFARLVKLSGNERFVIEGRRHNVYIRTIEYIDGEYNK